MGEEEEGMGGWVYQQTGRSYASAKIRFLRCCDVLITNRGSSPKLCDPSLTWVLTSWHKRPEDVQMGTVM